MTGSPPAPPARLSGGRLPANRFLVQPLPLLFAVTAGPVVLVMVVNGLHALVDAWFLGRYVGAAALTAVTLMFPAYMVLVALSMGLAAGFGSIFARRLGAGDRDGAGHGYAQALGLALAVCLLLILAFQAGGAALALWFADGDAGLAAMGRSWLGILVLGAPLGFLLAINVNALRSEGLLRAMTAVTLLSAALNIGFDWLFVARLGWGVPGSAWATVLAQALAVLAIAGIRLRRGSAMLLRRGHWRPDRRRWGEMLALGAPTSLGYIGLSLTAAATLYALQLWGGDYPTLSAAFGIVTRILTFAFMPLIGFGLAFQTILGNNYGGGAWARSNTALVIAIACATGYCAAVQAGLAGFAPAIGAVFVDDPAVQQAVARILPLNTAALVLFGPLMMIGAYFQAIGDAGRAAILGLSRTYAFSLPLIFALPLALGEPGIWLAGPVAEGLVLLLTIAVLTARARSSGKRWGMLEGVG
ncbi:MAG: MATE family efflux transporter [Sneathiellaceae bacterium]